LANLLHFCQRAHDGCESRNNHASHDSDNLSLQVQLRERVGAHLLDWDPTAGAFAESGALASAAAAWRLKGAGGANAALAAALAFADALAKCPCHMPLP